MYSGLAQARPELSLSITVHNKCRMVIIVGCCLTAKVKVTGHQYDMGDHYDIGGANDKRGHGQTRQLPIIMVNSTKHPIKVL